MSEFHCFGSCTFSSNVMFWYCCLHSTQWLGDKEKANSVHTAHYYNNSEIKEKKKKMSRDPGGLRRYGGDSSRAQEDTGLLDKHSQSWFLSTLTLFFPWLFAVLTRTRSSIRVSWQRSLVSFWKTAWTHNLLFPLGVASNFCLNRTSTQRQSKSLDPINYSIYRTLCNCVLASIRVMLYYTLLGLVAWV